MGGYDYRALILPDFGAECSQRLIRWLHLLGPNRCQLCPWEVARCELPGPLLLQFGIGFPADLLSLPTARVEGAARRRVHRARHVARQYDALAGALQLGVRLRAGGGQRDGIWVLRVCIDMACRAQLRNWSLVPSAPPTSP